MQPQTDSILGWVDQSGRPFVMDAMIRGYTNPLLDYQQDVHNTSGSITDGVLTINFSRKRVTDDSTSVSSTKVHIPSSVSSKS